MPMVVDENGATILDCPYTETGRSQCEAKVREGRAQGHRWMVKSAPGYGDGGKAPGLGAAQTTQYHPGSLVDSPTNKYGGETRGLGRARQGRRGPRRSGR